MGRPLSARWSPLVRRPLRAEQRADANGSQRPRQSSSDDIASALPGLSAIIAGLAKNASAIQAGATIAERFAGLAALFNIPGAADAELGIELAVKDIPTIVAVGRTVLAAAIDAGAIG